MTRQGPIDELAFRIASSPHTEQSRKTILGDLRVLLEMPLEIEDLEYAIRRYLAEHANLAVAVETILDPKTAAYLASEIAHDQDFCPTSADQDMAIGKLLAILGVQQIVWDPRFQGVHRIRRRLEKLYEEMMQKGRAKKVPVADLQRFGGVGWGYVETLLSMAIRFYSKAFGTDLDSAVGRAFAHALRCRTLTSKVEAIERIEESFKKESLMSRECRQRLGRRSPFEGLFDGMVVIGEQDISDEWLEVYSDLSRSILPERREEHFPLERLYTLKTDIRVYRNFFAHKDEAAIEEAGWEHALRSFRASRRFATALGEAADGALYPGLIVPVWRGQDAFDRFVIKFVSELDLGDDASYDISRACRMYPDRVAQRSLRMHRFYLCAPVYDGVFEPMICGLADVVP